MHGSDSEHVSIYIRYTVETMSQRKLSKGALLREIISFGYKEAKSCIFAGLFFILLFFSQFIPFFGILRYDRIFLGSLLIQVLLFFSKIESFDEIKVIFLFHVLGLCLELFKTSPGVAAWSYPDEGILRIMNVPLYSGFMYASVASYMSQAWKNLELKLQQYPSYFITIPLAIAIYGNFFSNHFFPDIRIILIPLILLVFLKTKVVFVALEKKRVMPLNLAFILIGAAIWIAENISTYLGAWKYPDQLQTWHIVHPDKISSWFLFTIVSFLIVADLKHYKHKNSNHR